MDVPLDSSQLEPLIEVQERGADAVSDEVRAQFAGSLPAAMAPALPILTAILVLTLHFLRNRIRPSDRCARCGREGCRHCDSDARAAERLCAQGVQRIIRRSGDDP